MPSTFNVRYQDTENGRWVQIGIKSTQNPDDYLYSEEDEYQLTEKQRTAQYLALIHHEIIPKIVEATDYWPRMGEMLKSGMPYRVYVQGEDVSLRGGVSGKINLYCLQNEAEAHYTTVFTLKPKFEVYNENFKKIRDVSFDDPVFLVRINWLERSELYTTVMSAKDSDHITEEAQKDITEYYKNNPVFPKVRTLPDDDEGRPSVPLESPLASRVSEEPPDGAAGQDPIPGTALNSDQVPETGELAEGSELGPGESELGPAPPKVEPPPKRWVYGYDGFEPPPEMRKAMEENIRASKRKTETSQSIPPAITEMLKTVAQLGNSGLSSFAGPGVTVTTSVVGSQTGAENSLHMPFPSEAFSPENFPQPSAPASRPLEPDRGQSARHAWATQQAQDPGTGQAPMQHSAAADRSAALASAAAQRVWAAQQAAAVGQTPVSTGLEPAPAPTVPSIPELPASLSTPPGGKNTTEQYLDWIRKRNQGKQ